MLAAQPGLEAVGLRLGAVERRLRGDAAGDELAVAGEIFLRQREVGLGLDEPLLGHRELRLGELELEPRLAVVEAGEDLALFDFHPLFDVDLHDFAGDLRRHGRLAPGGDVAGGVEHRPRSGGGRALDGGRGAHRDRLRPQEEVRHHCDGHQAEHNVSPSFAAPGALRLRAAIDLE